MSASTQKKLVPLADTQKRQKQKAKEAAEYRATILRQKQQEKEESSPSLAREKAAIKATKSVRKMREQRNDGEGMATTAQCAFNLANILMVSPVLIFIAFITLFSHSGYLRVWGFWVYHLLVPKLAFLEALLPSCRLASSVGRPPSLSAGN